MLFHCVYSFLLYYSTNMKEKQTGDSVRRMRRRLRVFRARWRRGKPVLRKLDATVQSWLGHARHVNTYRLRRRVLAAGLVRI